MYISQSQLGVLLIGQGCKVCPKAPLLAFQVPHTRCHSQAIEGRLTLDRAMKAMSTSEAWTIHERSVSYAHALLQHGCGAPELEPTHLSQDEREQRDMHHDLLTRAGRGVPLKDGLCQGRLLFNFDHKGDAFIWYVFATSLSSPVVVFTIFCQLGMVSCEH